MFDITSLSIFYERKSHVLTPNRASHLANFSKKTYKCLEFHKHHLFYCYIIAICKDQVLDYEDFTLPIYIVDNYYNIYYKYFILDTILIDN